MNKLVKILLAAIAVLAVVALVAINQRHFLMYQMGVLSGGSPPELIDAGDELPTTIWFDDYYTVDEIAPNTYAIGEPRYYQANYNYLLVGNDTAILFDAGPGVRDIRPVVESLTDRPVIFLPSHFHYDHVGNGQDFARRAVVDLPYLRARANGNELSLKDMEHLGPMEGFTVPTWQVTHWWLPGETIDLGGRTIEIIHTPGHSPESISILDSTNQLILSGDYMYEGPLFAFVPGASNQDYLDSAMQLLDDYPDVDAYYGGHRTSIGPPRLTRQDLSDLYELLKQMRDGSAVGEGVWPVTYKVNEKMSFLSDPPQLQDWD